MQFSYLFFSSFFIIKFHDIKTEWAVLHPTLLSSAASHTPQQCCTPHSSADWANVSTVQASAVRCFRRYTWFLFWEIFVRNVHPRITANQWEFTSL